MFDLYPEHPLKMISQQLYDHAAEHGFPPDFFTNSGAILTCGEKIPGVKVWLLDVVQRPILRADPLHALGKFTDVEMVIANGCMVLINIAAHMIKLLPIGDSA